MLYHQAVPWPPYCPLQSLHSSPDKRHHSNQLQDSVDHWELFLSRFNHLDFIKGIVHLNLCSITTFLMFYKDLPAQPTIRLMAIDSEENKCLSLCRMEGHRYGHGCPQPIKMDGTTELGEEARAGRTGRPKFLFNGYNKTNPLK